MISLRTLTALVILSVPASAEDWTTGSVARTFERPAHAALIALKTRPDADLADFTTDGCSGGLSEVWQVVADRFPDFAQAHQSLPPWEACCVTHDRAYHTGSNATDAGTSFDARVVADQTLRSCVIETGGQRLSELADIYGATPDQISAAYQSIAQAMYMAVRFGGAPCSGLPWRWGYGYPGCTVLTGQFD